MATASRRSPSTTVRMRMISSETEPLAFGRAAGQPPQLFDELLHLPLRASERARAVNLIVGVAALFLERELSRQALLGRRAREPCHLHQTLELLLAGADGDDELVELRVVAGLDQQRRLHHRDGLRLGGGEARELLFDFGDDPRMQDAVELRAAGGVGEDDFSQALAVNRAPSVENAATEGADDFFIGGLTGGHQLVGDAVGVKDAATAGGEI